MRQEVTIVLQASDSGVDRLMIFETVIDSLATGWEIDMTFLRRVTIQFGDIIWQTDNFSEVRQAYLEDDEIETIYQRNLLE
jgi:hypothetical protein